MISVWWYFTALRLIFIFSLNLHYAIRKILDQFKLA